MNKPTHYAYENNIKVYFRLYFDLYTNIPRWDRLKDDVWHVVPHGLSLAGLTMVEVK